MDMDQQLDTHVRELFKSALERFPHTKLSPTTKIEFVQDWINLARSVGLHRFEEALSRARLTCKFVPQAAEINEQLPAPELGKKSSHSEGYPACSGTGWIKGPPIKGGKEPRMRRCLGIQMKETA